MFEILGLLIQLIGRERRQILRDVNISFNLFSHLFFQVSIYTTRLGNNSEQNQNLCTIIIKK